MSEVTQSNAASSEQSLASSNILNKQSQTMIKVVKELIVLFGYKKEKKKVKKTDDIDQEIGLLEDSETQKNNKTELDVIDER